MGSRVNVLRSHRSADREAGCARVRAQRGATASKGRCNAIGGEHIRDLHPNRSARATISELLRSHQSPFEHQPTKALHPDFVVAAREVERGRNAFPREARLIKSPQPSASHRERHAERAPFPLVMKSRLIRFRHYGPKVLHSPHVMHGIHEWRGGFASTLTRPAPIIESRVMSSANCSSVQPSVPGGRSGSTK